MSRPDVFRLMLLAGIWGASFVWMRVAVPDFGALPLTWIRAAGGALVLLPLVGWSPIRRVLGANPMAMLAVGVFGIGLPYACLAFASQNVPAAVTSLLNATTPIFAALVAMVWLSQAIAGVRWLGFLIAFIGVGFVVAGKGGLSDTSALDGWSLLACLLAAASYGLAANLMRRYLSAANPVAVAACTQMVATCLLVVPAGASWPEVNPGLSGWFAAAMLAVLCTGLANAIYFRLVQSAGASSATSVTFLIPAFAVGWAYLFLGEPITIALVFGGVLVLTGCALATGLLTLPPGLDQLLRRIYDRSPIPPLAHRAWHRMTARLQLGWQAWQRARLLKRDEAEFRRLDAWTLRDLGVSASEHASYWVEAQGLAPRTRQRVSAWRHPNSRS